MEQVKPTSYRELEIHVLRWAEARKIIPNSTPVAQARKTLEEAGELLEAATCLGYDLDKAHNAEALAKFKDAAGDVLITLINACALADVDLVQCLGQAYEEIRERKGTLGEDGIFRKEA